MGNFVSATTTAIARLVDDFQNNPGRWWEERDLHWGLVYYLKVGGGIPETYVTELIRAEFPTLKKFGAARGHYDVAILDPASYQSPHVQSMERQDPWGPFLGLVKVKIAVEVKLWPNSKPFGGNVDRDIRKLTDSPHAVLNAFFLNFVQLDLAQKRSLGWYHKLRDYLRKQKTLWPDLRILCVPNDKKIQPSSDNWL